MNRPLVVDTVLFELSRSLTTGRLAIWAVLVMFPVTIFAILNIANPPVEVEWWGFTLYFLVPEVVCLLGLLLWATPAISTEIDGQTWIYLAMRRSGRSMVLLGKYLTAVIWTLSAALASISICMLIVGAIGGFKLWAVLCALALLSCVAHAAVYLFIGVMFHRRTMATAVVYTLGIEYGLSFVPALANKLTVNYRLRGLLADWMDWERVRTQAESVFGAEPASTHLLLLAVITIVMLTLSVLRLTRAEYPTQQEG
jgi:ABC-type transport system involved in multi-copper enzyme maturation permease subunit